MTRRPVVPVGAGVHTGMAFVGSVGSESTVTDFTAIGDAVNVTARLARCGRRGSTYQRVVMHRLGLQLGSLERRELAVRGRDAPLAVRVLHA